MLCIVLYPVVPWQRFFFLLKLIGDLWYVFTTDKQGEQAHFSFPLCACTSTLAHSLTLGKHSRKARGYAFSSVFWQSSAEIPGGLPPKHNVLNPQELLSVTLTI